MGCLRFFIDLILPVALWPCGQPSLSQKWVSGIFPGGKGGRCLGLTLPPSCADDLSNIKIRHLRYRYRNIWKCQLNKFNKKNIWWFRDQRIGLSSVFWVIYIFGKWVLTAPYYKNSASQRHVISHCSGILNSHRIIMKSAHQFRRQAEKSPSLNCKIIQSPHIHPYMHRDARETKAKPQTIDRFGSSLSSAMSVSCSYIQLSSTECYVYRRTEHDCFTA
jgi:hypothetical protein